jgi:hypothetical protein
MPGRRTQRRLVITGLAALLGAPAFVIQPASAAIAFTCDSVTGSATLAKGLAHDPRPQSLSSGPTAPAGPAEVTLASTNDAGVKANRDALGTSLSADGRLVAFGTDATNLDPRATETFISDIYVKDLDTGDLTLASTSDTGIKGNLTSWAPALSADGTRVAFYSHANNLDPADTDTSEDVYVKDLTTGDLMLASSSDTGVGDNGAVWIERPSISDDGTRVAFATTATNLDPADTDAVQDIYVKNLNTGNIDLASRSDTGVKGNGSGVSPQLSSDGSVVVFESRATNLDPADTDAVPDVYVKNRGTGDIVLASTSDTGVKGNDESGRGWLSADVTKVAFASRATNFDPRDTGNAVLDVYVKDLTTGDITLASTSDTGVKGNNNSDGGPVLSADGTKVVFSSAAVNLDPLNTNTDWDTYVKNLVTGDLTMVSTSDTGVGSDATSSGGWPSADFTRVAFTSFARNLDPADTTYRDYDIYVKQVPSVPTSIAISGCSNGNSGTASVVDIRSYGPRPLGCPVSLGGAAGNDYADTTPILVGATLSMTIDWATGPNSYGVAAAKAGPTPTQWRFRLAITASPGHDTPATNQYLPVAGSGFTKTRLQGKLDISSLDSFNCTSGIDDPISWVDLANNGSWVAKSS